jgi:hypothetical protein
MEGRKQGLAAGPEQSPEALLAPDLVTTGKTPEAEKITTKKATFALFYIYIFSSNS